ncbi:MAG: Macrolide export ATP-binding/permease protein MacB [Verrucomicrobiota bacterium]
MLADLRFALRQLRKSPGFAAVAILTLALGIGANTAIFSAVYALILKPLPFPAPDRLVEIYNTYVKGGVPRASSNVVAYLDYQKNTASYAHVALWSPFQGMYGEDATAERLAGVRTTAEIFDVLGLKPIIGQFFTAENHAPAADKVLVLTQSFWTAHYREDPGVLGKTVRLDGETFTIVGVAPRALEAFNAAQVRFVRPLSWDPATLNPGARHANNPRLFARLKPGVALGTALAEADTLERRHYDAGPPPLREFMDRAGHKIAVASVQLERVQPLRTSLLLLQGGVVLVLLIGCVNVANLLLARANARQSELAIRLALGAGRGAITRQLLLESLLLTTLGTACGLALATAITKAFNLYRAQLMPDALPFTLDGGVLGFTVAIAVGTALLISLAPIVYVLRANLLALIHRSSRGASGGAGVRALSSALIVGQVAVAVILLSGAGLLIHGFIKAVAVHPGFDPSGVIAGVISIPRPHRATDDASRTLRERVVQSAREIPGVSSVALALAMPFQGGMPLNAFTLADDVLPPGSPQPAANRVLVSPAYHETLRLSLVEGRFFEPRDLASTNAGFVVDENFAKKYFPGRSALGGRFSFGGRPEKDSDWPVVIGVVRHVPHRGVYDTSGVPYVYQMIGGRTGTMSVFLRTPRPAADTLAQLREKLRAIDPALALFDTGPLQAAIDSSHSERRAVMLLLVGFAGVALFLSALGLYGVLAYDVAQRTREIGVRGAIGATHAQIVGLIMRQGLWKTAFGLVLGLGGALLLSGYLKTLLYEVSPTDPRAYAAVSALLLVVAALACWLPARRAAKIDPMAALRTE